MATIAMAVPRKWTSAPRASAADIPFAVRKRAEHYLTMRFEYMDSDSFRLENIEQTLFAVGKEPELPRTCWYHPTRDDVRVRGTALAGPSMSSQEEKLMFLRFNYAKMKLRQLQAHILNRGMTRESAHQLVEWHRRFEHFREYLVRTNLALVLAMARRARIEDVDFAEIVSEGNMALIRAIDKFNVDRGFKFSTYACRAILKAFGRISRKSNQYRARFPVGFEPDLEKSDWSERRRELVEMDCIDELKNIVDRNLADLSKVEGTIIRHRFNWNKPHQPSLTLEGVGEIVGLTKERVRQIQMKALAKIKSALKESILRTTTATADEITAK